MCDCGVRLFQCASVFLWPPKILEIMGCLHFIGHSHKVEIYHVSSELSIHKDFQADVLAGLEGDYGYFECILAIPLNCLKKWGDDKIHC